MVGVNGPSKADVVKLLRAEAKKAGVSLNEAGATRMIEHAVESQLDPAKALKSALDGLKLPATSTKTLTAFISAQRKDGPKPVKPSTLKSIREAFNANRDQIQWAAPGSGMPLGQRFVRVEIMRERHPDGFAYTALIPVGALAPGVKPGDPNDATQVFIERSGGFAGMTQVGGPLSLAKLATNGRELRSLLEKNDDARGALVTALWPNGYAKSTPPLVEKVSKRADGNFDVTFALTHFRTGKKGEEKTIVTDGAGKAIPTQGTGGEGGISADLVRNMIARLNANLAGGALSWKREDSLPLGVRYERVELYRERHPDGYAYTALVPAGALAPGVKPDLSNVKHFFVERTGGFAGMTRVAGPIDLVPQATTLALGEEGGDGGGQVTTMAVGEEGSGGDGGGQVTTMAVGEEGSGGGGIDVTTMAVGEEGSGGGGIDVTTMAVGEEGSGGAGGVTTAAIGEEGGDGTVGNTAKARVEKLWTKIKKVQGRLTEELRTEDAVRSLQVIGNKVYATFDPNTAFSEAQVKAFLGKALKDEGVTLPLVLEREQRMTTMAVGEETGGIGGGGGTVTTLAVGEEGTGGGDGGGIGRVTTMAVGEESGDSSPGRRRGGITTEAVGEES